MEEPTNHPTIPARFELPELTFFYNFMWKRGGKRSLKSTGRNNPCVCGSGKKNKKCCGEFPREKYIRVMNSINDFPLSPCEECHIKSGLLIRN